MAALFVDLSIKSAYGRTDVPDARERRRQPHRHGAAEERVGAGLWIIDSMRFGLNGQRVIMGGSIQFNPWQRAIHTHAQHPGGWGALAYRAATWRWLLPTR